MRRRSSRIQEMHEKSEASCMWGLFSILESCHGLQNHMVISKGRPANRNIIDYSRQLDSIACFDEECRKIHNGSGLRSMFGVDAKGVSSRNCIEQEMGIEKHESEQDIVKRQQFAKMDAELLDRLAKTQKRTRQSSREVYQSSSCCLNSAARLMNGMPSTSAEMSLNELTLAAILGAVCAQNHQEESKLSEYFERNSFLEKYDEDDEINMQQVQMRAKAFVDQMFILREGRNSESKSFSNALEMLNTKRGLFMELLPDPNSTLARRITKLNPSQIEKDTIKSVLGADISECASAKYGTTMTKLKGNTSDNLWKKLDYQLEYSPKANIAAQLSDKIVILKPAPRNGKRSGIISCNCSSMHSPPNTRVSEVKTTSFSFREIKKKLKHTFGVTKKDADVASECNCQGVNSFDSSTTAKKKGKRWKKQKLKSNRGSDIACTASRKLNLSNSRSSNKEECEVILEAKRHLSMRLNNQCAVDDLRSKKSPRTLERILSSPDNDLWPFSPRRDSLYVSGSAEMRFSPYNPSPRVMESSSRVRNELRSDTEVTSCDDQSRLLHTVDAKAYSVIPGSEEEAQDTNISTTDDLSIDGESKIGETDSSLAREVYVSHEVLGETTCTGFTKSPVTIDTVKAQKCEDIDSLTENEAASSTSSNTHHLDPAENIKFQEEHQSPVSVLEPFFIEDANTPPGITLQTGTGRKPLQPRHLDFEECSFESFPVSSHSCMEVEMCQYVQLIMEASSLNWEQLLEIRCLPEDLLHESLFDEVELPPLDCYYDPKLLFDYINEVLLEIYKCHFASPLLQASPSPKIGSTPLAEVVLDEILAEADFFLLPTTENRTLNELVWKDVVKSRSWLDVRTDTEHIVIEVTEAVMEESLLDILFEFHTRELCFIYNINLSFLFLFYFELHVNRHVIVLKANLIGSGRELEEYAYIFLLRPHKLMMYRKMDIKIKLQFT